MIFACTTRERASNKNPVGNHAHATMCEAGDYISNPSLS